MEPFFLDSLFDGNLNKLSSGYSEVPEAPTIDEAPAFSQINPESFSFHPSQFFSMSPTNIEKRKENLQQRNINNLNDGSRSFGVFSQLERNRTRPTSAVRNSRTQRNYSGEDDLFDKSTTLSQKVNFNEGIHTPAQLNVCTAISGLRSINEISEQYRGVFSFPYFNVVQSRVFDDVYYTDKPVVVCAPTGGGKTVVFELAIIRLLEQMSTSVKKSFKIVYMAPMKALCTERYQDWKMKFERFGLKCKELTGDTELDDYYELQEVNLILTTPEKWDSMTRRWRDNLSLVQTVCLFFIDEIHVLNDTSRGATIEAVVSRMKTIQAARQRSLVQTDAPDLRFIAVSATIPNVEDIAEWLGSNSRKATYVKLDESARPVRLRKVILGFNFGTKSNEFGFDLSLSYRLAGIINTYSENKPTLVFCSTRKSTQQAAEILAKDVRHSLVHTTFQRQVLQKATTKVKDAKLRDTVLHGIGFHHAGMDIQDRKIMEELFSNAELSVLVATSTLAMGVNLPAHLVIVKSTQYYNAGKHEEYPKSQVLQMIGRAGRPQFDTSATAVIMTKNQTKDEYESLVNGTQCIESSLHKNLIEHLNAEIVLHTINDMSIAMEWIRYTFLYIRVMKNPSHYGVPMGLTKEQVEKRLQDLCMKNLNMLSHYNLISMDGDTFDVKSTETGRLMARYCIAFETIKKFAGIKGKESLSELLDVLVCSEEFSDIQLRVTDKKVLNGMNKDKNRLTIRYPVTGKIKSKEMKVNCLIQAQLGCLLIQDFALQQDCMRIFRAAQRVTRCLVELLWLKDSYRALCSSVILSKCVKAKLWGDSRHVSKQVEGIGPALSNALVNAGLTSFQKIEETNPREIELICNRHPPFGNQVREHIAGLPKYELTVEQVSQYCERKAEITVSLRLANRDYLTDKGTTTNYHTVVLLIGDEDNSIVFRKKIMDIMLLKEGQWSRRIDVHRAVKGSDLYINLISQDWVGLDVESKYTPHYLGAKRISTGNEDFFEKESMGPLPVNPHMNSASGTEIVDRVSCRHRCTNKNICGHDCCSKGKVKKPTSQPQSILKPSSALTSFVRDLKHRSGDLGNGAFAKRLKISGAGDRRAEISLERFSYNPSGRRLPWTPSLRSGDARGGVSPVKHDSWSDLDRYQTSRQEIDVLEKQADFKQGIESLVKADGDGSEFDISFSDEDIVGEFGDFSMQSSCLQSRTEDTSRNRPVSLSMNSRTDLLDRSGLKLQSLTSTSLSESTPKHWILDKTPLYPRSVIPHQDYGQQVSEDNPQIPHSSINRLLVESDVLGHQKQMSKGRKIPEREKYREIDEEKCCAFSKKDMPNDRILNVSDNSPKLCGTGMNPSWNTSGPGGHRYSHAFEKIIEEVTDSQVKFSGQDFDTHWGDWTDADTGILVEQVTSNNSIVTNSTMGRGHVKKQSEIVQSEHLTESKSSVGTGAEKTTDSILPKLRRNIEGCKSTKSMQPNTRSNVVLSNSNRKCTDLLNEKNCPTLSTFFTQKDKSGLIDGSNSPQKTFSSIFDGIF